MIDTAQHCLVVEAKIMRIWEKVRIYKGQVIQWQDVCLYYHFHVTFYIYYYVM